MLCKRLIIWILIFNFYYYYFFNSFYQYTLHMLIKTNSVRSDVIRLRLNSVRFKFSYMIDIQCLIAISLLFDVISLIQLNRLF